MKSVIFKNKKLNKNSEQFEKSFGTNVRKHSKFVSHDVNGVKDEQFWCLSFCIGLSKFRWVTSSAGKKCPFNKIKSLIIHSNI